MTANECARFLAQRAEAVAKYLLPNGKKSGQEYCVGDIHGDEGKSLKICLTGDKAGVFSDFASGEAGDLLTLWALKRNMTISEAIKESSLWLGLGSPEFDPPRSFNFAKPQQEKWRAVVSGSPVFRYLTENRKLVGQTISAYRVREDGRTIIFPYIQDRAILQYKYLKIDRDETGKKDIRTESNCQPSLFGWQAVEQNLRSITLCEGEIDCMTLHQYGVPALSVPFGAGKGDAAGQEAVTDLVGRLGRHRCRIVKLPHKDPNDCLQAGITEEEIAQYFAMATTLDPVELKQASSLVEKVIQEFYPDEVVGYDPPWSKAVGKVLFRPNELSIWTGINGHGKSQFIGQIMLSLMKQGGRTCVASLELKPQKLLMRLTRQTAGMDNPTNEYIRAIHQWYNDKLWIFDLLGTAKGDRLLEVFLYARQKYGVDVFVIDSFLKLDIAEDDYKAQKSFIEKLCDFKNEHNCQVHLIVHPRKSSDESLIPGKLDSKGSGSVSDLADNCFSVWRNKAREQLKPKVQRGVTLTPKEQEVFDKPDCFWLCDKQRNGDWEGCIGLWFDPRSFQYLNTEGQRALEYVPYSISQGNKDHE
jgi:twinkle protein